MVKILFDKNIFNSFKSPPWRFNFFLNRHGGDLSSPNIKLTKIKKINFITNLFSLHKSKRFGQTNQNIR